MKVFVLHCLSGTEFFAAKGDIVDVPDEEAARLIKARYARKLTPAEAQLNPDEDEVDGEAGPVDPAADAKAKAAELRAAKVKAAADAKAKAAASAPTTTGA